MAAAGVDVIGRDAERRAIAALLADPADGARALVLEGEAGIGKTTLWREAVQEARARKLSVLAAQPAQPEMSLPYAALGDLLQPLLDERLERLPEALRVALEVALQRHAATEAPPELAVFRATQQLLEDDDGIVIAVDDVQWLDPPSERALEFALRRLEAVSIRVVLTRRSEHVLPAPLGLDRVLPHERLDSRRLGPLTLGELHELVLARLGMRLSRPQLLQLREASGGNPFYAVEIARDASEEGFLVPDTLAAALEGRLQRLSAEAGDATLLAAAATRPTARLIERAADSTAGLTQAIAADVLALEADRLRFTHPLLASVAYQSAAPWDRREAHLRLAAAAEGQERALNLALGTEEPHAEVAAELEQAARAAAARGGPDAAAALAEHAARVTPPGEDRRDDRLVLAAEFWRRAGDVAHSREILEQLAVQLPPGSRRAEVLRLLAGVAFGKHSIDLSYQALEEAADAPLVRANVHALLANYLWQARDPARSLEHAEAAVRDAEEAGDASAIAASIAMLAQHRMLRALPWDGVAMERALALERGIDDFPDYVRPSVQLGMIATYTDDYATARPLLVAEVERMEKTGRAGAEGLALFRLAQCDLRAGNWANALRSARSATELLLQASDDSEVVLGEAMLALVLAHLGELDEADGHARQALARAQPWPYRVITARGAVGFVFLCRGDYDGALRQLTPARIALVDFGFLEFSPHAIVENEIDALVGVGRIDDADVVVQLVSDAGEPADRAWHRAVAARGQALTSSARGEIDASRDAIERALAAHDRLPQPFELGRTLLVKGQIERRFKSRAVARDALTRALEIFDELGAATWAERAAAELARIPGRARASDELTETERRVAELVAEGLSNREVAARLFITVRTVEANLTKVYSKLGIRSRMELARRLG